MISIICTISYSVRYSYVVTAAMVRIHPQEIQTKLDGTSLDRTSSTYDTYDTYDTILYIILRSTAVQQQYRSIQEYQRSESTSSTPTRNTQ